MSDQRSEWKPVSQPVHPSEPKLAATAVVVRSVPHLEVLLLERAKSMKFMAGAMVFPGGKVDEQDCPARARSLSSQRLVRGVSQGLLECFANAAVREVLEESGIAIVTPELQSDDLVRDARERLGRGDECHRVLRKLGVEPDVQALIPLCRWVTPGHLPMRFDTMFFFTEVDSKVVVAEDGSENVASRWTTPRRALELHRAGTWKMVPPTRWVLSMLDKLVTVEAMREFAQTCSLQAIVPEYFRTKDELWAVLPGDDLSSIPERVLEGPTRYRIV